LVDWLTRRYDGDGAGVAEPAPKHGLFQQKTPKTGRRSPARPNPEQDAEDLTNPELSGLNRLSSEFLR
jgi:hypothetical protein